MPGAGPAMTAAISDPARRRLLGRALSLAAAVAPFGLAFGVLCTQAGLHPLTALGLSVLVFTGSAQFAAVAVLGSGGTVAAAVLGSGGTVAAAVLAGLLLNVRCLAIGLVMAPVFPRSWSRRALASQLMIDEAMAVGTSVDEPDLRWFGYLAGGLGVFVAWNVSTLAGALLVSGTGTFVTDLGIDATIPAAFLALVWPRLADTMQRRVALLGGLVALVLVPLLPAGLPIILSAAAVPVVLWTRPTHSTS
ncbi:MAG TPA: AzlC family ABC transporter permease [Euzebyales bacterium]|nr:AzlC family ABC transporter permease [Euzebyales bacterium]